MPQEIIIIKIYTDKAIIKACVLSSSSRSERTVIEMSSCYTTGSFQNQHSQKLKINYLSVFKSIFKPVFKLCVDLMTQLQ